MAYLGDVQRQEHANAKEQTPVLPQLLFNPTKYFPICSNSLDGITEEERRRDKNIGSNIFTEVCLSCFRFTLKVCV